MDPTDPIQGFLDQWGITREQFDALAQSQGWGNTAQALRQRRGSAEALRSAPMPQGRMVGRVFVGANPLELAASAFDRYQGNKQMKEVQGQEDAGLAQVNAAQPTGARFALAQTLEKQRREAERVNAEHGMKLQELARQDAQAKETARHNLEMEKQAATNSQQDAWGAIADPVSGGILLYNKKTHETVPLGPGGGQPGAKPGPLPGLPGKPTEGQRKKVLDASESISQLDMAIDALKKAPGAYGGVGNFVAGLAESAGGTPVQSLTARRYKPEELRVKNYVSNVVSKIINERAGANVTLREELRQKFLVQDTDAPDQALQKLQDLKAMVGATYKAQGGDMVPDPSAAGLDAKIKVRRKSDGKTGSMPASSFNPDVYEKIE